MRRRPSRSIIWENLVAKSTRSPIPRTEPSIPAESVVVPRPSAAMPIVGRLRVDALWIISYVTVRDSGARFFALVCNV